MIAYSLFLNFLTLPRYELLKGNTYMYMSDKVFYLHIPELLWNITFAILSKAAKSTNDLSIKINYKEIIFETLES